MTINREVEDLAIRDPLETPVKLHISSNPSPQEKLAVSTLKSLTPDGSLKLPALCTPAHMKRSVIDGVATHTCHACGELVWTSPSTLRVIDEVILICLDCFVKRMRELKGDGT